MPFGVNPITGRPGPAPMQPRDGDKIQARQRINVEVRSGRRHNPNSLPCVDCGHFGDDVRHEYDHHLGYDSKNHYNVESVCAKCHHLRHEPKATHCVRGHEFTKDNTYVKKDGCRQCRECHRIHDRNRKRNPKSKGGVAHG